MLCRICTEPIGPYEEESTGQPSTAYCSSECEADARPADCVVCGLWPREGGTPFCGPQCDAEFHEKPIGGPYPWW